MNSRQQLINKLSELYDQFERSPDFSLMMLINVIECELLWIGTSSTKRMAQ